MNLPSRSPSPLQQNALQPRAGRGAAWAVLALAAAGAVVWAGSRWLCRDSAAPRARGENPPPPDPRLVYKGPYRNVHPGVKYVGDAACAGCHKTETDGFHRHPMGRSIIPVAQLAASQRYDRKVHNPFEALGSRFVVERRGGRVWHRQECLGPGGETVAAAEAEVHYVIGSGRRGHSYLTTRAGFLFQTPISWYSQKNIWDLSPGFRTGSLRPVVPGCVFCHASGARPVEHAVNRYEQPVFTQAAISCERYGPGETHVKARKAEGEGQGSR